MNPKIQVVSYGGGVQSNALLVLAAQGRIPDRTFLFSNVGDDSEHPDTLRYVREIAKPYADQHGIELIELRKKRRDGSDDTLLKRIERGQSTVPIPMRMSGSGAPGNRTCTAEFKIRVIAREIKRRGATKENPAIVSLGISLDEFHRARTDSGIPYEQLAYPLIDMRLSRQDCLNIIQEAGLPTPPKSSCFFCPYHSNQAWLDLLRKRPDLFAESVRIERLMNERRAALGKDTVWLTPKLRPLDQAVTENGQTEMFEQGSCTFAGYCFI